MSYVAMKLKETEDSEAAVHGGRIYEAARRWGIDCDKVLDFSASINPLGPPQGVLTAIENALTAVGFRNYPDEHAFVSTIANKLRLVPNEIVVGSGVASLIFATMHAVQPRTVLLMAPAFGEYDRACRALKAEVTTWLTKEENGFIPDFASLEVAIKKRQFDLVILNSPHNPTGMMYPRAALLSLIEAGEKHGAIVVLDEAFIDYVPQESLVSLAPTKSNLLVLRSLTKFYAMPGLRVGYAVSNARLAAAIRQQIDPWSVSTVALEAGRAALSEDEFDAESRRLNAIAREEFADALSNAGLQVFPSAANFLLIKLPQGSGSDLQQSLESERILIRQCDSFVGLGNAFIRLAVRSSADNMRLVSLIQQWIHQN
jgi:threonine-phosphate decarboxylase